jgi:hypothetical protein
MANFTHHFTPLLGSNNTPTRFLNKHCNSTMKHKNILARALQKNSVSLYKFPNSNHD